MATVLRIGPASEANGTAGDGDDASAAETSRWLGGALIALGAALALNSVLGPLVTDVIRYPFSGTIRNQLIGLDAISLFVVAPMCLVAGVLCLGHHPAGAVLGLGPALYTVYMFVQYLVGPAYTVYPRVLTLHLGLFILSGIVAVRAWGAIDPRSLPPMPRPLARRRSFIVVGLAVFVASRYVPAIVSSWSGSPVPDEFRNDPSFFWTILLMDVGIVVPAAVAVAVGLIRGTRSAARAMFALVGWFTLVPPSVAAMAVAMVVNNDENASVGGMVLFLVAAAAFAGFAVSVYRPLFHPRPSRTSDRPSGA